MFLILVFALAALGVPATAQTSTASKSSPESATAAVQRGVDLADKGHCREALALLRVAPRINDKDLRKAAGLATVKCALPLGQTEAAVNALLMLHRDFPHDPEVLYVTTHAYSDLATRASEILATTAPKSTQALELSAEAYEMQGKWDDAARAYRDILAKNPNQQGIHFRLGRIVLSEPPTPSTPADARKEFEAELKIDPTNAAAEYVLGELSAQTQDWDDAANHFSRATAVDAGFADAYRGFGMALNSAGKFSEAIVPLEKYVKMQPADPAGHYQLAIAYARIGRKQDAQREMALQQQADAKMRESQGQQPAENSSAPSQPQP
ncbi:MAG: tetratricopeptide repeat protein [Candidatus Acidiferrales bacterium]